MDNWTTHTTAYILPLLLANIMHMFLVKAAVLQNLAIPVSQGKFGKNKTWRGFILIPLLTGIFASILALMFPLVKPLIHVFFYGILLGLVYALSELPNSYFKRRSGITEGTKGANTKWRQLIIDKTDSLLGTCFLYYFISDISGPGIVFLFVASFSINLVFSYLLVSLKIKKAL
jgi:hypothetical protein